MATDLWTGGGDATAAGFCLAGPGPWAAWFNATTVLTTPALYTGYAQYTLLEGYRAFINGFFSQHTAPVVLAIATGQAGIALGMLAAADLAVVRGAMAERERAALAKLIAKLGPLPSVTDLPISEAIEAIRRDKKVVHGRLHFVIAITIGATMTLDDVTEDELRAVLVRLGLRN